MAAEPRLLALADAIADGSPVDWADAESGAASPAELELVRQLRLVAGVADVHHVDDAAASTDRDAEYPDLTGSTWGLLELRERVGGGSFGTVYKAWDPRLARDVALKLLHREASDAEASNIIDEGRLLARARHPHVITVYGADRHDGRIGIWMEFIRGRTLEQVLADDGPFGAREAALIGIDLCGALAAVHAQGVVHRDVKAHNVMRENGGRVVLMDFGAGEDHTSRVTSGRLAGTPLYMAPELFGGGAATPASDLYGLGVLLFRLVTGSYPVGGTTMQEVWQAHQFGDRRHLRDLRPDLPPFFVSAIERALASDPQERFESVSGLEMALAGGLVPEVGRSSSPTAETTLSKRWMRIVAIGAGTLALALGVWQVAGGRWTNTSGATAHVRTIAVRPLANLTGDDRQAYFAAGLSDVLVATLGGISAIRVVAVPIPSPGGQAPSNDDLAAKYPIADAVLDGSIQRGDGRVRVTARLVQLSSGVVLFSRSYDEPDTAAFALQRRLAWDLATDLKISVTENESRRLVQRYDVNAEAQNAYLRGRYLLDTLTRPNLRQARIEFERAVTLEPQYAPAHAGLASTYLALGTVGDLTPGEVRSLAPPAAMKALAIDPMLAEAALAVADVRFRLDWDWKGAEEAYRTAAALNPSYMEARGQYARFLAAAGRVEDGLKEAQDAYRIDPLSGEIHTVVGLMLYYNGRYSEAITQFASRPESASARGNIGLARSYAGAGRFQEALAEIAKAYELSGHDPSVQAEMARIRADAGDRNGARVILNALAEHRRIAHEYIAPQDLAYVHVALEEFDPAFALLNDAVDERASRLLWLAVDPRLKPLHSDPRFATLLGRLGIMHTP